MIWQGFNDFLHFRFFKCLKNLKLHRKQNCKLRA